MESISEKSKRKLVKEIMDMTLGGCIEILNQKIEKDKNSSPLYIEGFTRAKNIISELKALTKTY